MMVRDDVQILFYYQLARPTGRLAELLFCGAVRRMTSEWSLHGTHPCRQIAMTYCRVCSTQMQCFVFSPVLCSLTKLSL